MAAPRRLPDAVGRPPLNVDCAGQILTGLEERLEDLADRRGPAVVVGQSRGGSLARALAARRPDLVAGLVTLGSPTLDPLAVGPLTLLSVRAVSVLGALGIPRVFTRRCLDGACCAAFRDGLAAEWPADIPLRLGLLAPRRHRRLARLPGPRRRQRRGRGQPLRHGRPRRHVRGHRRRACALSGRPTAWRGPPSVAAIPDSARVVLEGPGLAHLVTIGAGGAPQVSCVWVGIEDGEIVFASLGPRRKLDNVRADPRVALSIEGDAHNQLGLRDYLVVHGTARDHRGRRTGAPAAPGPHLPRPGRDVPAHGRPAPRRGGADRRPSASAARGPGPPRRSGARARPRTRCAASGGTCPPAARGAARSRPRRAGPRWAPASSGCRRRRRSAAARPR